MGPARVLRVGTEAVSVEGTARAHLSPVVSDSRAGAATMAVATAIRAMAKRAMATLAGAAVTAAATLVAEAPVEATPVEATEEGVAVPAVAAAAAGAAIAAATAALVAEARAAVGIAGAVLAGADRPSFPGQDRRVATGMTGLGRRILTAARPITAARTTFPRSPGSGELRLLEGRRLI